MKRTAAFFLLLAATLLTGCGQRSETRILLTGGWAPPGQACDSHDGVFYDKTGTWAGDNVAGDWALSGDHLTTRVKERGGFDRPARKVTGEKPVSTTILSISRTELVEKLEDGRTLKLQRCRG